MRKASRGPRLSLDGLGAFITSANRGETSPLGLGKALATLRV